MFPENLMKFLNDQTMDGNDVHSVNDDKCDGYTWVIIPKGLQDWVIGLLWYNIMKVKMILTLSIFKVEH
jgi:hypothetical protein